MPRGLSTKSLAGVPGHKAYVVATGRTIAPFGDPVSETPLANETLARHQTRVLEAAGCTVERVDVLPAEIETPCLVLADDTYVSQVLLEQFLALAWERRRNAVLALEAVGAASRSGQLLCAAEREDEHGRKLHVFDVFYFSESSSEEEIAALRLSLHPVVVPRRQLSHELRMPRVRGASTHVVEIPITARVAGQVRHWLHVLRLNQMLVGVSLWDYIRANRRRVRRRAFRALLRTLFVHRKFSRSIFLTELFGSLNVIGDGAKIHPTAEVRGSFIGAGVRVGPGAKIRNSIIGDGTIVNDDCSINHSVIGRNALILADTFMAACVSYDEATISNYKVQLSLFGRESFLTASAALVDAKFNGNVRVEMDGELADSGSPFLGVCLGHRVTVGAHVTIQAGRAIPNDYEIVMPPEMVLSNVPTGLPTDAPLVLRGGTLEPFRP